MAGVKYNELFVNELYSEGYVKALRRNTWLIPGQTVNENYMGEATAGGAVIYALGKKTTPIKTGAGIYTQGSTTEAETEQVVLNINKPLFLSEHVPFTVETGTKHNQVAGKLEDQAASISEEMSVDSAGAVIADITTNVETGAIASASTIYAEVVEARATVKKAGANPDVMVVSEDVEAVLLQAPEFVRATDLGDRVVSEGQIGRFAGMNVFVATIGATNQYFLYDSYFLGHAGNLNGADVVRNTNSFGSNVMSGVSYGTKVLREAAFAVKKNA